MTFRKNAAIITIASMMLLANLNTVSISAEDGDAQDTQGTPEITETQESENQEDILENSETESAEEETAEADSPKENDGEQDDSGSEVKQEPEGKIESIVKEIEVDDAVITIEFDSDAFAGDVTAEARKVTANTDEYEDVEKTLKKFGEANAEYGFDNYAIYEISFYVDGEKTEPSKDINVSIALVDKCETKPEIIHINDEGTAELIDSEISDDLTVVSFANDEFSYYAVGWNEEGKLIDEESKVITSGLVDLDGEKYYVDENGDLVKGQEILVDGVYYYFQEETGKMYRTRWRKSGTSYVYYGEDGARVSGFQKIGEYHYYFDEVTGLMKKGWMKTADGSTYMYFDGQGHMAEGYVTMGGYKYYFNPETGYMKKGWMKTEDGSTYYYFDGSGHAVTGEKTIGGYKYMFLENGYMKKGWVKTSDGKTYFYYDGQGHKAFGEKKINGYWYNFEEDTGRMIKGWMRIEYRNKTVYYDSQGHMVMGSYKIGNIEFTADKSTGAVYYTYVRNIPYYSQTDGRWSGIYIGNAGTIAQNGCGPAIGTSIINFYKGKGFTPVDTARLFNKWGHYNSKYGHGTDTGVWRVVANNYGLKFRNNLSLSEIKEQLRRGNLVTAAVGRGAFVNGNYTHFILLYGLDGDKCWVYDPLHSGRNGKYSVSSIYSQKSGLYVDNIDGGPFIALGNQ